MDALVETFGGGATVLGLFLGVVALRTFWSLPRPKRKESSTRLSDEREAFALLDRGVVNETMCNRLGSQHDASEVCWTRFVLSDLRTKLNSGTDLSVFVPGQHELRLIQTEAEFSTWVDEFLGPVEGPRRA